MIILKERPEVNYGVLRSANEDSEVKGVYIQNPIRASLHRSQIEDARPVNSAISFVHLTAIVRVRIYETFCLHNTHFRCCVL